MNSLPLWPIGASRYASEADYLFIGLLIVTGLTAGLVFYLLILFCTRYRHSNSVERSERVKKSWHCEIGWTTATMAAFFGLFIWGGVLYVRLFQPPGNALEIYVVAKRWMWKAEHPGGQREIDELHVPVDRPVRLVLSSQDVIHSFYVPAFRLKHDVVPGRYQELWFRPSKTGEFGLFCAEFCGTDHAQMGGHITVMSAAQFEDWLRREAPEPAP